MKKILVVCAALVLPLSLVHAQEADDTGAGVGLSIIPRLDLSPEFSGGETTFTLGNSSIYTLFEGNITENLSFSVANHWLGLYATDDLFADTKDLYKNTWRSDSNNWVDWINLTYTLGDLSFTLGKDVITTGGFEMDAYDWEAHPWMCSSLWNNLPVYQWGAKLGYSIGEDNEITFQWTTSPYGEKPFSSKLFNYSLGWNGSLFERLETIWSVTAIQRDSDDFLPVISLGQRFDAGGGVGIGLDLFNVVGDELNLLSKGFTILPSVSWDINDNFSLAANFIAEINKDADASNYIYGIAGHWYPLKDSKDLRIHATAGYHSGMELLTLNLGLLYSLNFPRK